MFRKLFTMFIFSATVSWAVMGQQVFGREHLLEIAQNWQGTIAAPDKAELKEIKANTAATWQQVKQEVVPKLAKQIQIQMQQHLSDNHIGKAALQLANIDTQAGVILPEIKQCIPTHVFAQRYGLSQLYSQKNQANSDVFGIASL